MYDLICEGQCNPNISLVDDLAREYMSDATYAIAGRQRPGELTRLQRGLVHTPHVRDTADARYYICIECMSRRRYGG